MLFSVFRFRTDKYVLPQDSYDVMITELETLAGVINESVEKIGHLILNYPDQKKQHEESQTNQGGQAQGHAVGSEVDFAWGFGEAP